MLTSKKYDPTLDSDADLDTNASLAGDDEPKSTWDLTEDNLADESAGLSPDDDLRDVLSQGVPPQGVLPDPNSDAPKEDGSVESEMTEELFRDRN